MAKWLSLLWWGILFLHCFRPADSFLWPDDNLDRDAASLFLGLHDCLHRALSHSICKCSKCIYTPGCWRVHASLLVCLARGWWTAYDFVVSLRNGVSFTDLQQFSVTRVSTGHSLPLCGFLVSSEACPASSCSLECTPHPELGLCDQDLNWRTSLHLKEALVFSHINYVTSSSINSPKMCYCKYRNH
jgi:hypothetical protein